MITELTNSPKVVSAGTWSLLVTPLGARTINNGAVVANSSRVWTGESKEELEKFAKALPVDPTPEQKAAKRFNDSKAQNPSLSQFDDLLRIVESVRVTADKAKLVAAFAVPKELEPLRQALVDDLNSR